jgi:hypothetical protein
MNTVSLESINNGTLNPARIDVEISYLDKANYFNGADNLYPYISILKTKNLNQDSPILTIDGAIRTMDRDSVGKYRTSFTSKLDNIVSLHQEIIAGLTMAFTSVFPHSGDAPWDSNGHRNHGFWIR